MQKTLANLEKHEAAIAEAHQTGTRELFSMREHLNNIRKHGLYEAAGCKNFESYLKAQRIPLSVGHAKRLAREAEVAGHIEKAHAGAFSGKALDQLGTIRVPNDDGTTSQQIDVPKVKRVVRRLLKDNNSLGSGNGSQGVTAPMVKKAIADVLGDKPPKPLGEQLESEVKRCSRWCVSVEQLDAEMIQDAEVQYPGVATRLAKEYSRVASLLRRKLV